MKEKIKTFLEIKGYSLKEIGINSFGLLRDDALEFIELLSNSQIPILGGDILSIDRNNKIEMTDYHWSYEPIEENETEEQYIKNSIMCTKDYICKYPNNNKVHTRFLYDIVFP